MKREMIVSWADKLSEKLGRTSKELIDNGLLCTDFHCSTSVELKFEDGSNCLFKYAFIVLDEERKELAVFTEHCGYHVFSSLGVTAIEKDTVERVLVYCEPIV